MIPSVYDFVIFLSLATYMRNYFNCLDKLIISFYVITKKCAGKLKVMIISMNTRLDKYNCQMHKQKKISLFLLGKYNDISWSSKLLLRNHFAIPISNLELKVFLFRTKCQWPRKNLGKVGCLNFILRVW